MCILFISEIKELSFGEFKLGYKSHKSINYKIGTGWERLWLRSSDSFISLLLSPHMPGFCNQPSDFSGTIRATICDGLLHTRHTRSLHATVPCTPPISQQEVSANFHTEEAPPLSPHTCLTFWLSGHFTIVWSPNAASPTHQQLWGLERLFHNHVKYTTS